MNLLITPEKTNWTVQSQQSGLSEPTSAPQAQNKPVPALPVEIWGQILGFCDSPKTLLEARKVNKTFKNLAESNTSWRAFAPPPRPPPRVCAEKQAASENKLPASIYRNWHRWLADMDAKSRSVVLTAYEQNEDQVDSWFYTHPGQLDATWPLLDFAPERVGQQIANFSAQENEDRVKAYYLKAIAACPQSAIGTTFRFVEDVSVWAKILSRDGWLFDRMPQTLLSKAKQGGPHQNLADIAITQILTKSPSTNTISLRHAMPFLQDDRRFVSAVVSRQQGWLFLASERLQHDRELIMLDAQAPVFE